MVQAACHAILKTIRTFSRYILSMLFRGHRKTSEASPNEGRSQVGWSGRDAQCTELRCRAELPTRAKLAPILPSAYNRSARSPPQHGGRTVRLEVRASLGILNQRR